MNKQQNSASIQISDLKLLNTEITLVMESLEKDIENYFAFFREKEQPSEFLLDDLEGYADTIKLYCKLYNFNTHEV